jgi:hypothetical protein
LWFFFILARRMPVIASIIPQMAQIAMTGFMKRIRRFLPRTPTGVPFVQSCLAGPA